MAFRPECVGSGEGIVGTCMAMKIMRAAVSLVVKIEGP